ncbi:MAG: response regulator [Campylobacterota bacterium]|nr:response regulator [Campylobacterota bacterium]
MSQCENILIVEDESIVALEISSYIKELGCSASAIVSNAKDCLVHINKNRVDLVLMDINIKGAVDGISCAAEIKKNNDIPIIYISAFSDDETLERAIETDPIAYLTKPFNRKELKFALRVAMRQNASDLRVGDIVFDKEFSFDSNNSELVLVGEVVHMTKKEKQLLSLLIRSKNSVVSIYELENELWPDKESNENTRRALVSRLRTKLKYKFLETIHSVGYKLKI